MRYIDSGTRDRSQALGAWLETVLPDASEVRWQSGFFSAASLGVFGPSLRRLAHEQKTTKIVIGSNQSSTLRDEVLQLVDLLALPRPTADLGVVSYRNGDFHPKTYHLRRSDGSQCAYVGSANCTATGFSLNVEAGLILDTKDGDPPAVLEQIATAVDAWFLPGREGIELVRNRTDADALTKKGILAETLPNFTPRDEPVGVPRPHLSPLLSSLLSLPNQLPRRSMQQKSPNSAPLLGTIVEASHERETALPPNSTPVISDTPTVVASNPESRVPDLGQPLSGWNRVLAALPADGHPHRPLLILCILAESQKAKRQNHFSYRRIKSSLNAALAECNAPRNAHYPFVHLMSLKCWVIPEKNRLLALARKKTPTNKGGASTKSPTPLKLLKNDRLLDENNAVAKVPSRLWNELIQNPEGTKRFAQAVLDKYWEEKRLRRRLAELTGVKL